jgi:hypothetical protein
MANIHIKSTIQITLDTGEDVTTATTKQILYKDPAGRAGAWTATVVNTTYLRYSTTTTDAIIPGMWKLQTHAIVGGNTYHGDVVKIEFFKILE